MTKRVAGYGRVSTAIQVESGTSFVDQQARIEQECKRNGWELYKFYGDEGISGKRMENRPGIQSLITDAKAGKFDLVAFTKLDRVGRNLKELLIFWEMLEELGLKLHCIDDPSLNTEGKMGKVIRGILGTFAEFERELIRERMSGGREIKWKKGESYIGKPPFGYRWNKEQKQMEVLKDQAAVYQKMVSLYIDEHFNMIDIAEKLSDENIPTPSATRKSARAKRWTAYTVRIILSNPIYKGEATVNRFKYKESEGSKPYHSATKTEKPESEWVKITVPPLIIEDRWNQIQARRAAQKIRVKKKHIGTDEMFLAENIIYCGECGGKVVKFIKRAKKITPYYACYWKRTNEKLLKQSGRDRCILKYVNADRIDSIIWNRITEVLANPGKFAEEWLKDFDTEELLQNINNIKRAEADISKKVDRAYDLITSLDDADLVTKFTKQLRKDKEEHARIQQQLKTALHEYNFSQNKMDRFHEFEKEMAKADKRGKMSLTFHTMGEMIDTLNGLPFSDKRRITEAVVAPEQGGKALLRYPTPLEVYDDEALKAMPKAERVAPLTDMEPIVELDFSLDLDRISGILKALKPREFLGKESRHPHSPHQPGGRRSPQERVDSRAGRI